MKRQAKPAAVDASLLRAEPYGYASRRAITVRIEQPEFTSLCPMTGLPDFGTVAIEYVPRERIVELKSLKLYLVEWRQVGIFYEHVVNRILDDLVDLLDPVSMTVVMSFTPRGGISTTVTARHPDRPL